jgi:hypothetical protein
MHTEAAQPGTGRLSQHEAHEYLEALQTLTLEVDRAMDALATRALHSFEDSLARQRTSCSRLAEIAKLSGLRHAQGSAATTSAVDSPVDADLAERIKVASYTLNSLNKSYSALLRHSGDTFRQFAGLFQSYTGPMQQTSAPRVNVSTWSCEL